MSTCSLRQTLAAAAYSLFVAMMVLPVSTGKALAATVIFETFDTMSGTNDPTFEGIAPFRADFHGGIPGGTLGQPLFYDTGFQAWVIHSFPQTPGIIAAVDLSSPISAIEFFAVRDNTNGFNPEVNFLDAEGRLVETIFVPDTSNGKPGIQTLVFATLVSFIEIEASTAGLVVLDSMRLTFADLPTPVPLPATLPLLAGGLGLLGLFGWRRKRRAEV